MDHSTEEIVVVEGENSPEIENNHFECNTCSKVCKIYAEIKDNVEKAHSQKAYLCDACSFKCKIETELNVHIVAMHAVV